MYQVPGNVYQVPDIRVVTLTALQTAGAFVCAPDYRAVCTVQAAQPLYFVAASWLVVGTGELYAVVEWIPRHMSSVCTLDHLTCAPSSYRAFFRRESAAFFYFDFILFFGSS